MPKTIRSSSFNLIRELRGANNVAERLRPFTNPAYLSEMAHGEREINDKNARLIEALMGLPIGWLDRDNEKNIVMSSVDFEFHRLLKNYSEDAKVALVKFLMFDSTKN